MVFSSLPFLFLFLTVVLLLSHLLPFRLRNGFLLLANLVFYAYGEPVYILIMLGSILVNFFAGVCMGRSGSRRGRRGVLVVGIILNLAALGVFKYAGLFVGTLRQIPALSGLPEVNISLPIGISFYTFQAASYLIDVYWKDCEPSGNFINFACYISLFPQLIAGPIVRYRDVNEQLVSRKETPTLFSSGARLFVVGMAKKVLLANQFGMVWDAISADPVAAGAIGAWWGACAYTLQIYFDFAGYSDMARGLGRMLGFEFCINFNYPYISKSVTEFWRRWHISLSTWFRDYVYIPLGGNRKGEARALANLMIVFLVSGLWHGAGWTFVLWGGLHGLYQVVGKLTRPPRKALRSALHIQEEGILRKLVAVPLTFCLTSFAFLFFRANSLGDAVTLIRAMVLDWRGSALAGEGLYQFGLDRGDFTVAVIALAVLILADLLNEWRDMGKWLEKQVLPLRWVAYLLLLFTILVFGIYGPNYDAAAFIYFAF